jgi:ubiquinone/menaquinone biosynthesis C-methylase UbiE
VLEGDASVLPLPDGSADAAWISLVIHHIPDLEAAAWEIRRVLRPAAPVLAQADTFRHADTNMRKLTEEEFLRGKEQLRRAVQYAEETSSPEHRTNWLDLLVLR